MIYDDQPQMVEAARKQASQIENGLIGRQECYPADYAEAGVKAAFAAIDREALIEKARLGSGYPPQVIGAVLVAAGIIPERDQFDAAIREAEEDAAALNRARPQRYG